jgi:hypothetical protein
MYATCLRNWAPEAGAVLSVLVPAMPAGTLQQQSAIVKSASRREQEYWYVSDIGFIQVSH